MNRVRRGGGNGEENLKLYKKMEEMKEKEDMEGRGESKQEGRNKGSKRVQVNKRRIR